MLLLMFLGIPIAYSIGISSFLYILFVSDLSPMVLVQQIAAGTDSIVLLALPFFLLAGEIMNKSGITERLTRFVLMLIGPRRGGLSQVVVVANVLIAMVSGAAIASAAAVGSTMIPMMKRQGYPKEYAAALNASAATIGPVIPPSVGFIIYASVSGESVGKLFLAVRNNHPRGESHSLKEIGKCFFEALPGLFMPVIILGGIFSGLVTPTEAGVLAVLYGLVVGLFVYRSLKIVDLPEIFLETIRRSTAILFIIAGASCFGFLIGRDVDAEQVDRGNPNHRCGSMDAPAHIIGIHPAARLFYGRRKHHDHSNAVASTDSRAISCRSNPFRCDFSGGDHDRPVDPPGRNSSFRHFRRQRRIGQRYFP